MSEQESPNTATLDLSSKENPATSAQPVQVAEKGGVIGQEQTTGQIAALQNEINLADIHSIMSFGSKAQEQLTAISDKMLEGVKNKDLGSAGNDLNAMVAVIRGFDIDGLNPNHKPGLFDRILGKTSPVAKFVQRYEEVRNQIDSITDRLEIHKNQLLTDITTLDKLYNANLDYFHDLENYIRAGELKLKELNDRLMPEKAEQIGQDEQTLFAQELRDLRAARDELERRVHDLRLTRQVAMQGLPGIRLVQENDKGLISKINSTMVNTVPLWRQQLATAVTIYRTAQAAETVKAATDLTNDLLKSNAENLKLANAETRKQLERGVFDIEAIKQANSDLITTLEDSLKIAEEGKQARTQALAELQVCEDALRKTLVATQSATSRQATETSSQGN
jgi:uncharacterized protein YaaN involved in tellurite resistance